MELKDSCLVCGDEGCKKNLITCACCNKFTVHRYCLVDECPNFEQDEYADQEDEEEESIHWICEYCKQLHQLNSFNNLNVHESIMPAEPLIRTVWTGTFSIYINNSVYRTIMGLSAYLSSKACKRVHDQAVQFNPLIQLDIVQKSNAWPKSFKESGPTDENIGIYFFPSPSQEKVYDDLVGEMARGELFMRSWLDNAELLVFSSLVLPPEARRFQGGFYLWGALRGKNVAARVDASDKSDQYGDKFSPMES